MSRLIFIPIIAAVIIWTGAVLRGQEDGEEIEVREYDYVYMEGIPEPMIGTILEETDTYITIHHRGLNLDTKLFKTNIEKIKRRTTPLMAFNAKRGKVAVDDFEACYELARWSLQFPELREKTRDALRDCIKINPRFLDAYLLLSDLLREEYRKSPAPTEEQLNTEIELYRHAVSSGIDAPRVYYRFGLAVRKTGVPGAALAIFRKAIESCETSNVPEIATWSRQEAGEVLLKAGKPEEALAEFEFVLAASPDDFRSLLGKGEAKLMLGQLEEAGVALTQAATVDQYYPRPFMLLGSIAYMKGNLSDAEVLLGNALSVGLPDAVALTTLGLVHARMGKFSSAAAELAQVLAADSSCWQAEMARGYLAENEGKTEEAIGAYTRALQANQTSGMAHFKLAGAYYSSGEKDSAVRELNGALENGYRPSEVFRFLGRIEYERENYDLAARHLRYAIAADDKDADAHYMLAMCCLKLGLNLLAERHFEKAVDIDSAHVDALNGLGYLAYRSGNFEAARAFFTSVRVADPENSFATGGLDMIHKVLHWDRWEDNFKRPDFDEVSNGWTEENEGPSGIQISIESKAVHFSGKQREAGKKAFLSRVEDGTAFVRIEADMNGLQAAGARFGLRVEKRGSKGEMLGAIVLMKNTDGSLAYNYTEERSKWKSSDMPIIIQQLPLDAKNHTFGIGFIDSRTGVFELLFDGRVVAHGTCPPLTRAKEVVIGIYGMSDTGVRWTLIVDKVLIYRYRPESKKDSSGF